MKKLFFIVCCAALLVTGCKDGKNSPESANVHLADSLNEVIAQRDSEINDMMASSMRFRKVFARLARLRDVLLWLRAERVQAVSRR